MNRNLHSVKFSKRLGMWVAVAETARAQGKGSRGAPGSGVARGAVAAVRLVALAAACAVSGQLAWAGAPLPAGGSITSGSGTISQNGNTLTVNQASQNLATNWQSFDIAAGHSVVFVQPNASAVALNRVIGPDASTIYGSLSANGNVFLVNPNGVLFAPGAQVSVGGLAASTLGISDEDFAAGRYRFTNGAGAGSVVNDARIRAGSVVLLGPKVVNDGVIETPAGSTTLAAGDRVTVSLFDGLLTAQVDASALNAEIQNHGQILADGGRVALVAGRADSVLDSLINTDGLVRANGIRSQNGRIYLDGGAGGTVNVSGALDASAPAAGQGGSVSVLGDRVTLAAGAVVDVSGAARGGTALIGGDYQGKNPAVSNARFTTVDPGATILADGGEQGGRAIVWSNDTTRFGGSIQARGKGFAEVSGKGSLLFSGAADTGGGTLLLDPTNITVQASAGDGVNTFSGGQIATLLASNDVVLNADNAINWNAGVVLDYNGVGTRTLTLQAGTDINYRGTIRDSVAGGDKLNVIFNADRDANGTGVINIVSGSSVSTSGGDIVLRGGNAALTALPAFTDPSYQAALSATAAHNVAIGLATLDAGGGNVTVRGEGASSANATGVALNNARIQTIGSGSITIDGLGASGSTGSGYGVQMTNNGGSISTVDGTLTVQGVGRGTGSGDSGLRLNKGTFQATGSGNLVLNGLGSTGGDFNDGIVADASTLRVFNGSMTLTGTGRGTGIGSDGIELADSALVEATGSGNVSFNGTSTATGANTNRGVTVWLGSTVRTAGGALTLQGTSADPTKGSAISLESSGTVGGTNQSGPVTLTGDTINLASGQILGTGSLLLQPLTPTATIGLGDGATGAFNLSSSALGLIQNGFSSITFGRSDGSGAVDVRTVAFADPVTIRTPAGSGSIAVNGTLSTGTGTSLGSITLQAGGDVSLNNGTIATSDALVITGGSYTVNGASALTSNTLTFGNTNGITDNGTLTLSQTADTTIANAIGGAGSLVKAGANTLALTAGNSYSGGTTVSAGTLQVGNGGTSGTLGTGAVTNNATLAFDRSDASTVANVIGGTGSLVQAGTGTTTLAGANTYSGTTTVNAGTLAVTNPSGLGDTNGGTVVNGGGNLDLQNVALGSESVTLAGGSTLGTYGTLTTSTGTSSLSGPVTLAGPSYSFFNVANGAQLTVSGVVSGSGGVFTSNAGTLVFGGTNTYGGGTLLGLGSAGTLAITNNSALGTGSVNLRASTTLDLRNVAISEPVAGNGGTLLASTGVNTVSGNVSSFSSIPVNVLDGAQLTIASNMTTPTPLVKGGNGLLTLAGNNTRAGTTTINAGTVQVGNGGTTGTLGSGAVTVAGGASLVFDRSDTVSLSTLAGNAGGITGQGNVSALIGGGFNVDRAIMLTGANSSILLEAGKNQAAGDVSGGDVTLTSNIGTSATGTVTIFSGNASTAAYEAKVGGAAGTTRYKSYGATASSTGGAVAGTRNYDYRQQPGTLSVGGLTATKAYDGLVDAASALDAGSATVTGLIDGDALAYSALTLTGASFDSAHAGARTVNATFTGPAPGYSGGGATWSVAGYGSGSLAATAPGTITPRAITSAIDPVGKTYDGTTGTTSTLGAPTGFVGGDSASGVSGLSLAFDNPDAGTRHVVASGSGTLGGFAGAARGNGSGIGAGNEVAGTVGDYAVVTPAPASAVIGAAALTVTANNDAKIVTQSDAPGYNGVSFNGFVHGESAADLGGTLSIVRSNAGTEAAGSYAGVLAPSGYTSGNYAITYVNGDYRIVPAQELLVRMQNVSSSYGTTPGYTIVSAEYLDHDGGTIHTLTQTAQNGNSFSYSDGIGGGVTFTVAPSGAVQSGAGFLAAGNYGLALTDTSIVGGNFTRLNYVGNQTVTPLALTPQASGVSKVYDGTTGLVGLTMDLGGKLAGDQLSIAASGAYGSKNAGAHLDYTVNGISLGGPDAGNYFLANGAVSGSNGVITPRQIVVNGLSVSDKVYDGTTAATLAPGASLGGLVAGDTVGLSTAGATAVFDSRNVGTSKPVTVGGLLLEGADAANYQLAMPTGLAASIMPRQITVSGLSASDKVYDGTTAATLAPGASLSGLVAGDTVGLSTAGATAVFDSRNVGTSKPVTVGGLLLDGADAANYQLAMPAGLAASIMPRQITVSGLSASDKVYDGTTAATLAPGGSLSGLVAGDTVGLSTAGATAVFDSRNVGTSKPVTVSGLLLDGADAANYQLAMPTGLAASITPRSLTIVATPNTKTYDGSTAAAATPLLSGGSLAAGDSLVALSEAYASPRVGSGLKLVPTGQVMDGNGGANYAITYVDSAAGEIRPTPALAGPATDEPARLNGDRRERAQRAACAYGDGARTGNCSQERAPDGAIEVIATGLRLPPGASQTERIRWDAGDLPGR